MSIGLLISDYSQAETTSQILTSDSSKPPARILLMQEVGLTDDQVDQLEKIQRLSGEKILQKQQEIEDVEKDLEALLADSTASEQQIRPTYQKLELLRQQFSSLIFENRLSMRALLSPEQRLAFEKHMKKLSASKRK